MQTTRMPVPEGAVHRGHRVEAAGEVGEVLLQPRPAIMEGRMAASVSGLRGPREDQAAFRLR